LPLCGAAGSSRSLSRGAAQRLAGAAAGHVGAAADLQARGELLPPGPGHEGAQQVPAADDMHADDAPLPPGAALGDRGGDLLGDARAVALADPPAQLAAHRVEAAGAGESVAERLDRAAPIG